MGLPFHRSHGLGNDYLVIDGRGGALDPTPERVQRLCDRHRGVGSDGLLLQVEPRRADFGLRIFNPDGSEAEKSGNGLRIFAHHLYTGGHAPSRRFTLETFGGAHQVTAEVFPGDGPLAVEVEMGRASFLPGDIPADLPGPEAVGVPLEVGGRTWQVTAVSVGNPHCVLFVDGRESIDLAQLGPLIERHPAFPNRTNVQVARVVSAGILEVAIWERGAGLTLASGSSACAAAAAAVRTGRCRGSLEVSMAGGSLAVEVDEGFNLRQRGPVEGIARGELADDLMAALGMG